MDFHKYFHMNIHSCIHTYIHIHSFLWWIGYWHKNWKVNIYKVTSEPWHFATQLLCDHKQVTLPLGSKSEQRERERMNISEPQIENVSPLITISEVTHYHFWQGSLKHTTTKSKYHPAYPSHNCTYVPPWQDIFKQYSIDSTWLVINKHILHTYIRGVFAMSIR